MTALTPIQTAPPVVTGADKVMLTPVVDPANPTTTTTLTQAVTSTTSSTLLLKPPKPPK